MILPAIFAEEDILNLEDSELQKKSPSLTYKLDIDTGEIYAIPIDGNEAIAQAVVKMIKTNRDRYLIYTSNYGSELEYLVGKNFSDEYVDMEVKRLVKECLIDYDRVKQVISVNVQRLDEQLYIDIEIETDLSDIITVEVVV